MKKRMWLDFYPVDAAAAVVTVAGKPEPATSPDGSPITHPNGEPAVWLPLIFQSSEDVSVPRSVKVPSSVGELEVGVEVVLGGMTVTPYPAKKWARGALTAETVTAKPAKKLPRRNAGEA